MKATRQPVEEARIDYKKAYDMVPHTWINEVEMFGIVKNVGMFLKDSMTRWQTELTAYGERLGEVRIKRSFSRRSVSPRIFIPCMVPLSMVLRKMNKGYEFKGKDVKVNHLLYIWMI